MTTDPTATSTSSRSSKMSRSVRRCVARRSSADLIPRNPAACPRSGHSSALKFAAAIRQCFGASDARVSVKFSASASVASRIVL